MLSPCLTEAASADEAGMKTCIVKREGNAPLSDEDCQKFNVIETFSELTTSVEGKKFFFTNYYSELSTL